MGVIAPALEQTIATPAATGGNGPSGPPSVPGVVAALENFWALMDLQLAEGDWQPGPKAGQRAALSERRTRGFQEEALAFPVPLPQLDAAILRWGFRTPETPSPQAIGTQEGAQGETHVDGDRAVSAPGAPGSRTLQGGTVLSDKSETGMQFAELAFAARLRDTAPDRPSDNVPSSRTIAPPQGTWPAVPQELASPAPLNATAHNPELFEEGGADALLPRIVPSATGASERRERPGSSEAASSWSSPVAAAAGQDRTEVSRQAQPAASDPVAPEAPARAGDARDVSVRLADGRRSVDIRMAERAGEIRVTVHTGDHDLANSLRGDLPDLMNQLRQGGFQAEAWHAAPASEPPDSRGGRSAQDFTGFAQQDSGRDRRDHRQQRDQEHHDGWAGEWNASLGPA